MTSIFAFVGHSFEDIDKSVVDEFLDYFRSLQEGALPDFKWENAKRADIKTLAKKVLEKMEDKNTFIGICTRKEIAAQESELLKIPLFNKCVFEQSSLQSKTSDWIIQEIGLAIGKELNVVILLEEGVRKPGGLQGDAEYVPFNRNNISKCFPKLLEALCAILCEDGIMCSSS